VNRAPELPEQVRTPDRCSQVGLFRLLFRLFFA